MSCLSQLPPRGSGRTARRVLQGCVALGQDEPAELLSPASLAVEGYCGQRWFPRTAPRLPPSAGHPQTHAAPFPCSHRVRAWQKGERELGPAPGSGAPARRSATGEVPYGASVLGFKGGHADRRGGFCRGLCNWRACILYKWKRRKTPRFSDPVIKKLILMDWICNLPKQIQTKHSPPSQPPRSPSSGILAPWARPWLPGERGWAAPAARELLSPTTP